MSCKHESVELCQAPLLRNRRPGHTLVIDNVQHEHMADILRKWPPERIHGGDLYDALILHIKFDHLTVVSQIHTEWIVLWAKGTKESDGTLMKDILLRDGETLWTDPGTDFIIKPFPVPQLVREMSIYIAQSAEQTSLSFELRGCDQIGEGKIIFQTLKLHFLIIPPPFVRI